MTADQIECLIKEWGPCDLDPVLKDPWGAPEWVHMWQLEQSLRHCPDPGKAFSERFVETGRMPAVLKDQGFANVRLSIAYLSGGHCPEADQPLLRAVKMAWHIARDRKGATLLKAMLLTSGATIESVAKVLGLEPAVVLAFNDLFYNVLHRQDDLYYLRMILDHAAEDEWILHVGFNGTINEVLHAYGCSGRAPDQSEQSLYASVRRMVLSSAAAFYGGRKKSAAAASAAFALICKQAEVPQDENQPDDVNLYAAQVMEDYNLVAAEFAAKSELVPSNSPEGKGNA